MIITKRNNIKDIIINYQWLSRNFHVKRHEKFEQSRACFGFRYWIMKPVYYFKNLYESLCEVLDFVYKLKKHFLVFIILLRFFAWLSLSTVVVSFFGLLNCLLCILHGKWLLVSLWVLMIFAIFMLIQILIIFIRKNSIFDVLKDSLAY